MDNTNYVGPVAAAVVLDKNNKLQGMAITASQEESLMEALSSCMQRSVKIDSIEDMRVLLYDFPNLKPIPEIDPEAGESYYTDRLLPVINELGLTPSAKIQSRELAFAMMHDMQIDLNKPNDSIRLRSDLAQQYEAFSCGFIDLMGKDATILLSSGKEIEFGLKMDCGLGNEQQERSPDEEQEPCPMCMAMVLDNKDNNLLFVMGATLQDETLAETLQTCMGMCTRQGGVQDLRVEQYTFSALAPMPESTEENHTVFYDTMFLPAAARLGIKPDVEVHSNEVLYALMNGQTLDLGHPEKSLQLREDYAEQCRTFPEKLPELVNKNLHVVFPSGLSLELGLRHASKKEQKQSGASRRVPSVKPPKQKHGVN